MKIKFETQLAKKYSNYFYIVIQKIYSEKFYFTLFLFLQNIVSIFETFF